MKFLKKMQSIFFPPAFTCDICGIETFGSNLCPDCLKSVTFNSGTTCPVCGRKTVRPEICLECKADAPLYKKAVSPLVYDGGVIRLIAKFKNGSGYLKDYFADLMATSFKALPAADCIVSVPVTPGAKRRRGYDQCKLLAHALSARTGVPVLDGAVLKVKKTREQKGLSLKERTENLEGSFRVAQPKDLKGKDVLLVDDVQTTGATAREMCKVLLKAGCKHVYFITAASVEYKPAFLKELLAAKQKRTDKEP